MPDPQKRSTAAAQYEAALEASCDALITLQLLHASMTSARTGVVDVEAQLIRAIQLQRRALAQLRLANPERGCSRVVGFVIPAPSSGQSKPRRTA